MTQEFGRPQQAPQPTKTYSDLFAVLCDVERSVGGSFMERSIVRGLFLGPPLCLVACALLGNLLVLAGPHRSEAFSASINFSTGIYGFFLGVFVGPIVDAIRKDKKAAEQALEQAVVKFSLSANDIARVLRNDELKLPKTAGAFARLRKRKLL